MKATFIGDPGEGPSCTVFGMTFERSVEVPVPPDVVALFGAKIAANPAFKVVLASAEKPAPAAPDAELVLLAVRSLDPEDDKQWTGTGLPAVEAVKAVLGSEVTRKQIEDAAPDFTRETARQPV
jgi:hypothetical protein